MPSKLIINKLINENIIGEPYLIQANLEYKINKNERIIKPELGDAVLLDLGVYPIKFIDMFFNEDIKEFNVISKMHKNSIDEIVSGS